MRKRALSSSSSVVAVEGQVSSDLGGEEFAILNLKTGTYYGLDAVGARIWALLLEPRTVDTSLIAKESQNTASNLIKALTYRKIIHCK